MPLPFQPESFESLRAKLPVALSKFWDVKDVLNGGDRPGLHREYIFDTEDGMRLIISCDFLTDVDDIQSIGKGNRHVLHISGSTFDKDQTDEQAISTILTAFKKISGLDALGIATVNKTKGGVVHVIYPLSEELLKEQQNASHSS